MQATIASAALVLPTDKPLSLSPKFQCYKIATSIYDPLPSGTVTVILGRSGSPSQRFIVYPVIIEIYKEKLNLWLM